MDIALVEFFADYNAKTNRAMNDHIAGLTQAQWDHEFGGYFKSIKELCNHLYVADFNWLKRFSNLRSFSYRQDPLFEQTLSFDTQYLPTTQVYLEKRKLMDSLVFAFSREVRPEDLQADLRYVNSHGESHTKNFGGLVLHFFNHQTHHRGMISIYLESLNVPNEVSDLLKLL